MTSSNPSETSSLPEKNKTKRTASLIVKLVLTVCCFWYISTKIDFGQAFRILTKANILILLASVLLYVLSKIVSAYRFNTYFQNIQLQLPQSQNLKLYWLGMFYNLFLPGAIGGDAYKVILLRRHFSASYKQITAAVLLDRFSGLLGLGILLSIFGVAVFPAPFLKLMFASAPVIGITGFYFVISRFFSVFRQSFLSTLLLGIVVQAIQVVGVYLILLAVGIETKAVEWLTIFLAAQVITVLPISLGGGLGTREVLFAEGARYFQLDASLGVAVSLLFYLLSVVASAWGVWYVFKSPLKKIEAKQPLEG